MAVGNTFGATALSSYGGFWIAFGIVLTPGGFNIVEAIEEDGGEPAFLNSFGLFLFVGGSLYPSFPATDSRPGMVHLHHHSTPPHPPLDRCLLPALLNS